MRTKITDEIESLQKRVKELERESSLTTWELHHPPKYKYGDTAYRGEVKLTIKDNGEVLPFNPWGFTCTSNHSRKYMVDTGSELITVFEEILSKQPIKVEEDER